LRLKKEKDEPSIVEHPFFKDIKEELQKILEALR
jgi:hypothetical protein